MELLDQCIAACEPQGEGAVATEGKPVQDLDAEEGAPAAAGGSSMAETRTTQQPATGREAGDVVGAGALEEENDVSDPPDELLLPVAKPVSTPHKPGQRPAPSGPSELQPGQPCPKQSFHVTALSVVAPAKDLAGAAPHSAHPALVSAVTVTSGARILSLLLVHSMKPAAAPEKTKTEPSKKLLPPPDDPLMDYMFDLDPVVPFSLGTQPPPLPLPTIIPPVFAGPPSNMLDVLGSSKREGTDSRFASVHLSCSILLRGFSGKDSQGCWPEIQHIVPLNGGRVLAVSVSCKRLDLGGNTGDCSLPHGGLLLYRVLEDESATTIETEPMKTLLFSSEAAIVASMCALAPPRLDGEAEQPDHLAVVTQGGSLVVYDTVGLGEVARHSPGEEEDGFITVTYCPVPGQLAAATRGGRVALLSLRAPAVGGTGERHRSLRLNQVSAECGLPGLSSVHDTI